MDPGGGRKGKGGLCERRFVLPPRRRSDSCSSSSETLEEDAVLPVPQTEAGLREGGGDEHSWTHLPAERKAHLSSNQQGPITQRPSSRATAVKKRQKRQPSRDASWANVHRCISCWKCDVQHDQTSQEPTERRRKAGAARRKVCSPPLRCRRYRTAAAAK